MQCLECGTTFTPYKSDQRFCCNAHKNRYHNKEHLRRKQASYDHLLSASSELDQLKQENEALREQIKERDERIEYCKEVVRRHHNERDSHLEKIENLEKTIVERNREIERLKFERRVYHQERSKKSASFRRDHLERVLNSEIRRQFPKDVQVQTHIDAIRHFNASYINALVAQP